MKNWLRNIFASNGLAGEGISGKSQSLNNLKNLMQIFSGIANIANIANIAMQKFITVSGERLAVSGERMVRMMVGEQPTNLQGMTKESLRVLPMFPRVLSRMTRLKAGLDQVKTSF